MKIFLAAPPVKSRSLNRVATALEIYQPPGVHVVDKIADADFAVLHVIGRCEQMHRLADELKLLGKKYAVIQYCLRSTQKPHCSEWTWLWENAEVVWSYYDLRELCRDDKVASDFNFYHAPLGVNSSMFHDRLNLNGNRPYFTMTHGQSWLTEGVREVVWATHQVGKKAFHLGQRIHGGMNVFSLNNIDDPQLSSMYSQCEYVCPLRRIEGFELPAAEGLLCGARPVLFDKPHYRQWYGDWAEYIPEVERQATIEALVHLFMKPRRPVSQAEIEAAKYQFSWPRVTKGFWEQALQ